MPKKIIFDETKDFNDDELSSIYKEMSSAVLKKSFSDFRKKFKDDHDMLAKIIFIRDNIDRLTSEKHPEINVAVFEETAKLLKNRLNDIKADDENFKLKFYRAFKAAVIAGEDEYEYGRITYVWDGERYKKPSEKLEENMDRNDFDEPVRDPREEFFDKLLERMDDGDSWRRGSSDEYKSIRADIKLLKKVINLNSDLHMDTYSSHRIVRNSMMAVVEKMSNYIKKRAEVEETYTPSSYRGNRVRIMRQLRNLLKAEIGFEEYTASIPNDKEHLEQYSTVMSEINSAMGDSPYLEREINVLKHPEYLPHKTFRQYGREWETVEVNDKNVESAEARISEIGKIKAEKNEKYINFGLQ